MTQPPADSSELAEFRRQWQAEVRAKQAPAPTLSDAEAPTQASPSNPAASAERPISPPAVKHLKKALLVDAPVPGHVECALEHYLLAIAYEQEGNLTDALAYYQRAFKQCSTIDNVYRRLSLKGTTQQPTTIPTAVKPLQSPSASASLTAEPKLGAADEDNSCQLADQLAALSMQDPGYLAPHDPHQPFHIGTLPEEVLILILRHLLVVDMASIGTAAQVCKHLRRLTLDPSVWRWACEFVFSAPALRDTDPACSPEASERVWQDLQVDLELPTTEADWPAAGGRMSAVATESALDWLGRLEATHLSRRLVHQASHSYRYDWRRMFIEKPRIRWDGVYISTCYYMRSGRTENTWYQPVHLVTYYRYMRFYRDGRCVKLLTTDSPRDVVRFLQWKGRLKGLMHGRYRMTGTRLQAILTDAQRPHLTFHAQLTAKSPARGRHNKLSWVRYYSVDVTRDGDRVDYSLEHFKPYYFSRVRAFAGC
ncbi:hypothetical protein H4R35_000220 [Dimargaris xerosporica]|nr:hypothetical protein H4R35_000220 [Dimargaris xerosporica]